MRYPAACVSAARHTDAAGSHGLAVPKTLKSKRPTAHPQRSYHQSRSHFGVDVREDFFIVDIRIKQTLFPFMPIRLSKITILLLMLLPGAALAQGTVSLNNIGGMDPSLRPYLLRHNGDRLSKSSGRIQILSRDGQLVLNPISGMPSSGLTADGLFALGVVSIPGTEPGGSTQVTLQVWDSSSGDTYELASEKVAIPLTLVGLGSSDLDAPKLLQISTPTVYPRLPPGVQRLTIDPLQYAAQNYLRLSAQVRTHARYRLEVSTDFVHWSWQQDLITGSLSTPPEPEPQWPWAEFSSSLPRDSVTYFRLVGVGAE